MIAERCAAEPDRPPEAVRLYGRDAELTHAAGEHRFVVSVAVLSLLAEAAEERTVLCLIDAAHWLDDASAETLAFVARRIRAEGVAVLFASRDSDGRDFDAAGLPE